MTGTHDRLRSPFVPWEWAPAGVLAGWGAIDALTNDSVVGSRALVAVALVVAAALLTLRRRAPFVVLIGAAGVQALPPLAGAYAQSAPGVLVLVIAIFSVGRWVARPWSWLGLPLGVGLALLASASDPRETLSTSWTWSLNAVWILALGLWIADADRRVDETRRRAEADRRTAAAEERLRVSRDLHDVLAHSLSLMVVQAEVADEMLDTDLEKARAALGNVQATGREALRETRGVLGALRAEDAPSTGIDQLPSLITLFRSAGLPVELNADADLRLEPTTGEVVYRMVQECLTNVLRHAGPCETTVDIAVEQDRQHLRVRVVNGRGSVPPSDPGPGDEGRHGLLGMRERVEGCGGRLEAGPLLAGGFAVTAELPRYGAGS